MTKLDREQMKKDYEESKKGGAGTGDYWTAQEGSNLIRIMPPWKEGAGLFYMKTYNHWHQREPHCCQRRMFGQRCYLCEKVQELKATGDVTDKTRARELQAQKNVYMNIVDLKNAAAGVQVWRVGGFTQIMAYANDEADYPDITDPKTGFDFKVERTGTDRDNTKYVNRARKTSSSIYDLEWLKKLGLDPEKKESTNWLKQLNDLDQFSVVEDYENQKSLYGYIFGEGPPPDSQPTGATAQAAEDPDDDDFDNRIERDPGAKLADDKVGEIKAAYCVQMDKFGSYNEEKEVCQKCTMRDNCAAGTKAKQEAMKEETPKQKAKELTDKMQQEAKKK